MLAMPSTIRPYKRANSLRIAAGAAPMERKWTSKALSDLMRLYEFLSLVNKHTVARAVQAPTKAPTILQINPCAGWQLFQFELHEIRYEIQGETIYMLQLWHTREDL